MLASYSVTVTLVYQHALPNVRGKSIKGVLVEYEARSLGADEFVAYDREDVAAVVRARYPKGIGAILDLVDDAEAVKTMASLLREGGSIVSKCRTRRNRRTPDCVRCSR